MLKTAKKQPLIEIRAYPRDLEARNQYIEKMENLLETCKREKRSLTVAETREFETLKAKVAEIDLKEKRQSFDEMVTAKEGGSNYEHRMLVEQQKKDLMEYLVKGEMRNLTATTNGSGGALVPTEIAKMIIEKIISQVPLLRLATRIDTPSDISVPLFDYSSLGVGYITENTELVDGASQEFTNVKLTNYIIAGILKCSRSLVNRADFDVLEYLVGALSRRIGLFLENQLILGTGTDQLRGLTTLPAEQTITTDAGTFMGDDIIDLMSMLPSAHAENGIFICSPQTWAEIQKMKTTNGDYLFSVGQFGRDMGNTLLGKPLFVSDAVPNRAVGNKFLYFVDPQALTIKMTRDVGIQVLDQTYASSYNYGILGFVECDSAITSTQGVSALVGA